MRRFITSAMKATIAGAGLAIAGATLAAAPAQAAAAAPAGSTWTAVPVHSILVDTGRDLAQVRGDQVRTLVAGSTFQRKYGSFSKDGRKIVYSNVGIDGFGAQLWVMNSDGSQRKQITALDSEAFGGKFSPDGKKIAFQTQGSVWLVDASGRNAHQLSKPGAYYGPGLSWSPDSSALVATRAELDERSGEPFNWQVVTIKADGAKETALTSAGGDKNSPAFSPDGKTIIFSYAVRADASYDLYAMNADGKNVRQLTKTLGVGEQDAVFSPNGTAIAYAAWARDETTPRVIKAKADGSAAKSIDTLGYPTSWS